VLLLLISWAAGLAAYGIALLALRGEVLSLDNWIVISAITLVAWLVASVVVTVPILRLLALRCSERRMQFLPVAGAALAIVPVWLTVGYWYGWHPGHLLIGEAGFLGLHYAVSGLVFSLALADRVPGVEHQRWG
jgi:hypothetical protein